jgi:MFS transporter, Spinster family, sphingosine-1-phosphate transporter
MIRDRRIGVYYIWIVVGILWVVSMLNYLDRLLLASMRDPIKVSIHMTETQFGLLTTIFLLTYGVLSPLGGYIADRYSRKMVIVLSLLFWSVFTLWTGFVHSFGEMLAARALTGISQACYLPAAMALITEYHKGRTRSLATGLLMSGLYAGLALGGAGGYIADFWGWRFGFQLFGGFGIVYALILFFILRDASNEKPTTIEVNLNSEESIENKKLSVTDMLRGLFGSRSYWILILYSCLLGMTFWVIYAWLPTYFKEQFNLSLGVAGISATAFLQVSSFIGVLAGGILADRWSLRSIKGRIYVPVIGFIVGGPFLFLTASTGVLVLAIMGMILFGLAKGFHDANFMPIICQVTDSRYRATGYGILSFFSVLVGAVMIYVGGAIRDANISLSVIFQLSAAGVLLSGLILLGIRPQKR